MSRSELAALFNDPEPAVEELPSTELSSKELRQLAYERANDELEEMLKAQREMHQRHKEEERKTEARITRQRRFLRDLSEQI